VRLYLLLYSDAHMRLPSGWVTQKSK